MNLPRVFAAAIDYGLANGAKNIGALPGCWESQIDEHWWIALNGHEIPMRCSQGAEVPPFSLYVIFNGWPAGIVSAGGGVIAAGSIANEEALLRVLTEHSKVIA